MSGFLGSSRRYACLHSRRTPHRLFEMNVVSIETQRRARPMEEGVCFGGVLARQLNEFMDGQKEDSKTAIQPLAYLTLIGGSVD
jgi:hypothetical protein